MIKYKIFISFIMLVLSFVAISQTPSQDPNHYLLDTEDSFNSFNYSLWGSKVPNNTWGLETFDPSKVTASGGVLTLECQKVGSDYISGGIETVGTKTFTYGYFEIESKLPASGTRGPWGGFWMHTGEGGHDEIDVLEPFGCDTELGTQFHSGSHATHDGIYRNTADVYGGFPDLSVSYNKYALIWTPEFIQVLINDIVLYEIVNPLFVPTHPMYVFLTFQIQPSPCDPPSNFPTKYWRFRNFKYYTLKTDCTNGITQSNFNFTGHDYKVQKFYSLSNSSVPSNSNIVLRATDYIQINGEFTVPFGSTFTAVTHCNSCPN